MATVKAKHVQPRLRKAAQIRIKKPNLSIQKVMLEAGYSETYARASTHMTSKKTWQELMEEYLPDTLLSEKHNEFLNSKRRIRTYQRGELKEETEETDSNAVKALDMAYKLKGRYQDINVDKAIIINMTPSIADKYKPRQVEKYDVKEQPPSSLGET